MHKEQVHYIGAWPFICKMTNDFLYFWFHDCLTSVDAGIGAG